MERPCRLKGRKRRRKTPQQAAAAGADDGLRSFGDSMKETDLAELKVKESQLAFE